MEEISGLGVIGFTTPFVAGPTLENQVAPWSFRLQWLREIISVVDFLNLEYGIIHQDIADRNLFVNPATGPILLFDFGCSTMAPNAFPGQDNVKGVMFLVYFLITRDPKYSAYWLQTVDEKEIEHRDKWVKHAEVELDHDVSVFYDELMAWIRKRRDGRQPTEARHALDIPWPPSPPKDMVSLGDLRVNLSGNCLVRQRIQAGRPVLNWRRPPKSKVDPSRRLLATGRYADEEGAGPGSFIAVPDPNRGFPQPPVSVARKRKRTRSVTVSEDNCQSVPGERKGDERVGGCLVPDVEGCGQQVLKDTGNAEPEVN